MSESTRSAESRRALRTVGLFAGVGGFEEGFRQTGHETALLCEVDAACRAVLEERFTAPIHDDVTTLSRLPPDTELLAAGFPCQDLSQAGQTCGITGARSGLIGEVFRLITARRVPWVLLENVPFMLQLGRGQAMHVIIEELERLDYRWAYRVVDSRCFGIPQRRRRVYLVASLEGDPREVLFADEAGPPREVHPYREVACGFYWTEGVRGLGWAVNSVPTLKGGSTVGIPSPPAIVLPSGEICRPEIRDAERLQGFEPDWTKPAESVARPGARWKLVGNAVSVPAAAWIGGRLAKPGAIRPFVVERLAENAKWPTAAWGGGGERLRVEATEWPQKTRQPDLGDFLAYPMDYLSEKATAGFLARTSRSSLRFPEGFLDCVREHLERMQRVQGRLPMFELHGAYRIPATAV